MGRIDEYTRRVYAEILMGFIRKDYRRVAEVHFEAGYVPPDRDIDEFARALRAVGEPIFGMDASRISMARLLAYLFEVTERFGMETRTELILLQRTMVVVEGVARSAGPAYQHLAGRQPDRRRLHPREHRAQGRAARSGQDRAGAGPVRPETARAGRGAADPHRQSRPILPACPGSRRAGWCRRGWRWRPSSSALWLGKSFRPRLWSD